MTHSFKALTRSFFARDTVVVAQELIGKLLVHRVGKTTVVGMLSETEAYKYDDPASHAFRGKTGANSALFGEVGHAYIYLSYGLHFCLNAVAYEKKSKAGGVLLRAVIPQGGLEFMHKQRKSSQKNLANGPGKLTQAFAITKTLSGVDLCDEQSELFIAENPKPLGGMIIATERIGISQAKEYPWRFLFTPK